MRQAPGTGETAPCGVRTESDSKSAVLLLQLSPISHTVLAAQQAGCLWDVWGNTEDFRGWKFLVV